MFAMPTLFAGNKVNPNVFQAALSRFFRRGDKHRQIERPPQRHKILFESLEPRLLMSADFNPVAPMGSLIHQAQASTVLEVENSSHTITLSLDAGQQVSVLFTPLSGGMRGEVELLDPDGHSLEVATAGTAGELTLFNSARASSAGDYDLVVRNLEGTGSFTAEIVLNAALESESLGMAGNDDLSGAQALDSAWIDLPVSGQRAAVLGRVEAGAPDMFRLDLSDGDVLGFGLASLERGMGAGLRLELLDGTGGLIAVGTASASNIDQVIDGFTAGSGTYYLRVTGVGGERYSLLAARQARMDLEPNDNPAQAEVMSPLFDALGSVGVMEFGRSGPIRVAVLADWDSNTLAQLNDDSYYDFTAIRVNSMEIDTLQELNQFDVVLLGSWQDQSQLNAMAPALRAWVEAGHGVVATGWTVAMAGLGNGGVVADLDAIVPVSLNTIGRYDYTNYYNTITVNVVDSSHPVTQGVANFDGELYQNIEFSTLAADPGAVVLGTVGISSPYGTYPAIVAGRPGQGRGVYLGPAYPDNNWSGPMADRLLEQAVAWAAFSSRDARDDYLLAVNEGDHLLITTTTPGGVASDPGDLLSPVNSLDPMLQLFAPDGTPITANDNDAGDGRNALLDYIVPAGGGGVYRLSVTPVSGGGDYTLHVDGANGVMAGASLDLIGVTLVDGALLNTFPSFIDFTFSRPVRLDAMRAGDFTLSDGPGNAVNVSGWTLTNADTVRFLLESPPLQDSHYNLHLAANVIRDLANGAGNAEVNQGFDVDVTPPQVIWQSVYDGDRLLAGDFYFSVNFSEELRGDVLGMEDVRLVENFSGRVIGPASFDFWGDSLQVGFGVLPEGSYTLTLFSNANGFRDPAGNLLDHDGDGIADGDLVIHFGVDTDELLYPTPLNSANPAGSLLYGGDTLGVLYEPGGEDVDTWLLDLATGQRFTVGVFPVDTGLRANVTVYNPGGDWLGSFDAAHPGDMAGLNNLPVDVAGRYRIEVRNLTHPDTGEWTSGRFTLGVLLNGAAEEEAYFAGVTNNDFGGAQNLNDSFIDLGDGVSRGAVEGSLAVDAARVLAEQHFDGAPGGEWVFNTLTDDPAPPPNGWDGSALSMYSSLSSSPKYTVLHEADWTVDLTGVSQATLSFREIGSDATAEAFAGAFLGHYNADGVAISQDGNLWFPLLQLNAESGDGWNTYSVDLDAAAAAAGFSLDGGLHIRFQYFDDPFILKYRSWDDIVITTDNPLPVVGVWTINETGNYYNGLHQLVDGITPDQWSNWDAGTNVWWFDQEFDPGNGMGQAFMLDLGSVREVADLMVSVDNNDDYAVDWSADGVAWNRLTTIPWSAGEVDYGMDTLSSVAGDPDYASEMDFANPVMARFLRVYATGGDGAYAIGEVRVLGQPGVRVGVDQDWYAFTLNDWETVSLALHHDNPEVAGNIRLELYDPDGRQVALGVPGDGQVAQIIANFVAHPALGASGVSTSGEFRARVFGMAPGDYNLVLTRNADFGLETGSDQVLRADGGVLGAIVGGETDSYLLHANPGDWIELWFTLPGDTDPSDGGQEFLNGLLPAIQVFDPNGNEVALDYDGGNGHYSFTVSTGDPADYRVVVSDSGGAGGEYVLHGNGATGAEPDFHVTAIDPVDGRVLADYPNWIRLDFSAPVRPDHVNNWDLWVLDPSGNQLDSQFTWIQDADTVYYYIGNSLNGEGLYTVMLGGDTLFDTSGRGVLQFESSFWFDDTSPRVIASSVEENAIVASGDLVVNVQFSEAMLADVLDATDVLLRNDSTGATFASAGISYDVGNRIASIAFTGLTEGDYSLTLYSRADAFRDVSGKLLDGEYSGSLPSGNHVQGGDFVVHFAADHILPVAYPTPLLAIQPDGSLIHDPVISGLFHATGDSDDYTLDLDGGQTLSVVLSPADAGARGNIMILAPDGSQIAEATGLVDGQPTILQTAPVAGAGLYTIRVSAAHGAGAYQAQAFLNTALEQGDAVQDIDASFIPLAGTAERGAARGTLVSGDSDWYGFSLDAGQSATLLLSRDNRVAAANLILELHDGAGNLLASGRAGSVAIDQIIKNFTPATAGTFLVRVSGDPAGYSLLVLREAQFDLEPNSQAGNAQTLTFGTAGTAHVLGYLGNYVGAISTEQEPNDTSAQGGSAADLPYANDLNGSFVSLGSNQYRATVNGVISIGSDWDWDFFKVSLSAGDFLAINLNNAGVGDPYLHLYNSGGSRIAYNDDYYGLNSYIGYTATYTGDYYIVADSYSSRTGGYQLIATVTTPSPSFGDGGDQYLYAVNPGDRLVIETATPGGGAGEPVNPLDPQLFLYAPDGSQIAFNQNSAADGRNARIEYTVPDGMAAGSLYRIEIRTENATKGSYVLSVTGSGATAPAFSVTASNPANAALLIGYPATYTVDLSEAILLTSVAASDLTVDGVAADSVAVVDADTLRFTIGGAAHGDAVYSVNIAGGALTSVSGKPLAAFTATFDADATAPRVIASSLASGDILEPGGVIYTARFSEELASGGLGPEDVRLLNLDTGASLAPLVGYDAVSGTLTASLGVLPEGNYRLVLVSAVDAFRDRRGNLLDGENGGTLPSGDGAAGGNYVVDFRVDASGATPLTTTRVAPLGSLVYDPPASANLYAGGDVDLYGITLDAGQKASVRLTLQNAGLSAQLELLGPDGSVLPGASVSGTGGTLILRNLPIDVAGGYTVRITGLGGSGNYETQLVLNAQLEAEAWGGAGNDAQAGAESLDASAIALQGGADRLAVLGGVAAGNSDWYRFTLAGGQAASLAVTRTDVTGGSGLTLELFDSGGARLALGIADAGNVDQAISGFVAPAAGEYFARISAASALPYSLVVTRGAEFGLENSFSGNVQDISPTLRAVGYLGGAGGGAIRVAVLNNGNAWQVVNQLNDDTWFDFTASSVDYTQIDTLAELNNYDVVMLGDSYTSHSQIAAIAPALRQWVEAGGGVVGTGWVIYDSGSYTGTPIADINAILPVDTSVTHLYQYNPLIHISDGGHPVTAGVADFYPGSYAEYSPTVDPGATVLGYAGSQAAVVVANVGAGRGVYLGPTYMVSAGGDLDVGSGDRLLEQAVAWAAADRDDRYSFQVTAGQALNIRTFTPYDGVGEPANSLDARLELYDPNGNLVASDDNGADGDDHNANILYTAAAGGRYELRVLAATTGQTNKGDYIVQVSGATLSAGPAPTVVASSPVEGANFLAPPASLTLTLSEGLLATSVQASDLVLDHGAGVTGVTLVDGRTVRFTITVPDVQGTYSYTLAEGVVSDLQGQGNVAYTGHFTVDHSGARVVSQNPEVQGSAPFSLMTFTFNENIDPASVSTADIVSFTGPTGNNIAISSVSVSGNTLTVNFAAQNVQGTYTLVLGPNINDLVGNSMDQNQDGANGQANDAYTAVVQLQSPDLRAASLSNPAAASWGDTLHLAWTVENIGADPARNNWYDAIYLSSDATLDGSDSLLHYAWASVNPLAAGTDYTHALDLALPLDWNPIEGTYYLLLSTDAFGHQPESSESNNVVAGQAIHITLPAKPDLVVSNLSAPADLMLNPSGDTLVPITWTITNQGTAAATGWYDYVYLSSDNSVGGDVYFGGYYFEGTLNPGESATRGQSISLPYNYVGNATSATRWLVVTTDAWNSHYEVTNATPRSHPDAENNNSTVDDASMTVRYPALPNLTVTAVTPPDHSYSGQDAVISWTVSNVGAGATSVPTWYDWVYLSTDNVLDSGDTSLGQVQNPSYLPGGGSLGNSYTSSLHYTLPQGISGSYYYLVKTDIYDQVFENQNETDNLGSVLVNVELTPPPDLQVVARNPNNNEWESSVHISAPGGLWSGQAATVTWAVTNRGDGTTQAPGGWYDRVYLSTDASTDYGNGDILLGTWYYNAAADGQLASGASYTRSGSVTLPIGMPADGVPTTYYFYVVTDANRQVYEYVNEGNNDDSYASAVVNLTPPPDLEPGPIHLPASAETGHAFSFNYTVTNYGTPTPNSYWFDRFWLSADDVLNASDLYLGDRNHYGVLDTDASYGGAFVATLPSNLAAGGYRVIMRTDYDNRVFEGLDNPAIGYYPEGNNTVVSDVMSVVSNPADLVIDSFSSSTGGEAGKTISASWSVRNAGSGDSVVIGWTDQLVASLDALLGNGDDVVLYTHNHSGLLAAGAGYSVNNVSVALPITLASGEYTLFLRTDAGNQVYESDNGNNSAANPLSLNRQTADLQVVSLSGLPADITAGSALSLNWRVENLGVASTNVNYWYDDVFLSLDTTLDGGDIGIGSLRHNNVLAPNTGYDAGATFTLSTGIAAGNYYVIARTDRDNVVVESPSEANNTRVSAATVAVAAWAGGEKPLAELRPDLSVTAITLPPEAYSGQGVTLSWTVANQSAIDNTGSRWWNDSVYLSRDLYFDRYSDLYLGYVPQYRNLAAGDSYGVTQSFTVPSGYTGPFYAFVVTDASGSVAESNETNNITRSANVVSVSLAPPSNLVAGTITIPANGVPGQRADISYSVSNGPGANSVFGTWKDTLYLSSDTVWDIDDIALGSVWTTYSSAAPLAGGDSYGHTLNVTLPGVNPGDYHVIVRSDILNSIPETNEEDNLSASLDAVSMDAEVLPLGGSVSGNLGNQQAVYYKLDVTAGETVKLSFDSTDGNAANEIYVRYGVMPSLGRFDYSSLEEYSADPTALIPETRAGTYYVMVLGASVSGAPAYTLSSAVIPFSITHVRTDVVGNAGEATLRIDGARFAEATRFALRAPDGTLHADSKVFVEDSSRAYVTFNLLQAAAGVYDVVATQADGQTTALNDTVTVIANARGANLFSLIDGPSQVTTGRINSFMLQYTNQGDGDSMAPLLIITGQADTPLGYASGDLRSEPIYFLGASLDGPMDILRPDTGYSQQVLFRAPGTAGQLNISVATIQATDNRVIGSTKWNEIKAAIKPATPAGMSDAAWNAEWDVFWGRIRAAMGDTWGDYVRMLNQAMLLVSEQGSPVRDIRTLMATVHDRYPDWRPASNLSGRLLDSATGAALANVELAAYRATARGVVLGGYSTTDANGYFTLSGLQPGAYSLTLSGGGVYDMNRNGVDDSGELNAAGNAPFGLPSFDVGFSADRDAGNVYVLNTTRVAHTDDSAPVLATAPDGTPHILWLRDGRAWHAWYDGSNWVDAVAVSGAGASDLSLVAAGNLLDASNPGLIAVWQQNGGNSALGGNDSEIWYAVARPRVGGGYQWSEPIRLTHDNVSDRGIDVVVVGGGQVLIVDKKEDVAIQDDADIYYYLVDVATGGVVWTASPVVLQPSLTVAYSYDKEYGPWSALGMEVGASIGLTGSATQSGCAASVSVGGKAELTLESDNLGITLEGHGNLQADWGVDLVAHDWDFHQATASIGISGELDWKNGLLKMLGAIPTPATKAAATFIEWATALINSTGLVEASNGIKGSIGLDFSGLQWTIAEPFPSWVWPNVIAEAAVNASVKAYAGVQVKDNDDWKLEVEGGIVAAVNVYPTVELTKLGGEIGITLTLDGWDLSPDPWFLGYEKSSLITLGDGGMGTPLYLMSWNPGLLIGSNANYSDSVSRSLLANVASDVAKDGSPALASDSGGTYAAWTHGTGDIGSEVRVSSYTGGAWSAPVTIAGSVGFNSNVNTITDANGRRMAVWANAATSGLGHDSDLDAIQAARDANDVMYSLYDSGAGVWSTPALLAATAGRDASLTLTRDASGNVVLGWIHTGADDIQHLVSATWNGTGWTAPETIASNAHLGQLELGLVGNRLTAFWTEDVSAAGDSSQTSLRGASYSGGVWSGASAFSPALLSASLGVTGAATSQGFSLAGSEVPLQGESLAGILFGPPPDECFKCKPEDIKKVTESAPNCRPGGGTDVQYDPEKCLERTIIYAPCAVRPRDPNDILGPNGFGDENWITATQTQAYTIRFENAADATAPAQQVVITQVLDSDLDARTFRIDDFGWGDFRQELGANRSYFTGRLDFTATTGYYVDVAASVDVPSGTLTWTMTTIDPATGEMPADAGIGFLPVNDTVYNAEHQVVVEGTHRGEGFVSYTVRPKNGTATGAVVDAQATIVFDTQGPIETPAIAATLDAGAPSSQVNALPAGIAPTSGGGAEFLVTWGGEDDTGGSAIADYTIYVSVDGGAFSIWQLNTALTEALYSGTAGHSYAFYSTARDNAGNEEAIPAGADAGTVIVGGVGTLSGMKFEDMDGDGVKDAGEAGLSGWTLYLDADGNGALDPGELSTVTGTDGSYSFNDLAAGNHVVAELARAGWIATTPVSGSRAVTVVGGQTTTADFGNFHLAQIGGIKFNDLNANGIMDGAETGLSGWTINLDRNGDGSIETTATTNQYGYYRFTDLGPGTYVVTEVLQTGWLQTNPAGGGYTVTPYSGEDSGSNDFGNVMAASISGRKFEDVNGNSAWDAGVDRALAGWTIYLDGNANGVLESGERFTVTDADGLYRFDNLLPGGYTIAEVMQAGWVQTYPAIVSGSESPQVTLTGSEALLALPAELVLEDVSAAQVLGNTLAASLTHLDAYRADSRFASLNGAGISTVVIDTGIDLNHSFFGPDSDGNGVADRIVYQWDFADHDGNASDHNGHGSNVSSLIASSDAMARGVAPDASLIVLKVFSDAGAGNFGYLEQALQWTLANIATWNIGVINLSLGDGENWANAASMYGIGDELAALADSGVIITAAAGNSYYQYNGQLGVSYPAADPAVLAVGAVWSGDFGGEYHYGSGAIDYSSGTNRIAAFSQRDNDQLDVFAPGTRLLGANATGGTVTMYGTSQASAYLAGIATLAQDVAQANLGRNLTTAEFASLLASTGGSILDGDDENDNVANTGLSFHTLDMLALAEGIISLGTGGGGGGGSSGTGGSGAGFIAGPATHRVTLAAGDHVSGRDFGNFRLGEIGGTLFDDFNADGIDNSGDSGLGGWTIYLDDNHNGALDAGEASMATGGDGAYLFTGVGPGTHRVGIFDPGGWGYTTASFFDVFMESGGVASRDFGANRTPTVVDDNAGGDEDQAINGNVSGNDSDPDGPAYTAQLVDDVIHGSLLLNANGGFTYAPDADWHGEDRFTYRVSDGVSLSNLATVILTVNPVNDAPTADPVLAQNVDEGQTLSLTVVGHDVDGDPLSYSLLNGPGAIDPVSGAYRFTALDGNASHTVGMRVGDGHADSFFDVFFDISVHNVAPTLGVTGAGSAQAGVAYSVNLGASDPGQDTLTGWSIDWGDGTISSLIGAATSASHTYATAGNYSILASATDEDGTYAVSGPTVSVSAAANHAPTADTVNNQNVDEGQTLSLTVVGHDVDGDPLSYSLLNGPGAIDPVSGAYRFTALDGNASHTVGVRVGDGHADSFFDVFFDISVHNVAPTLAISGPATGHEGQAYSLALGHSDPGQDTLSGWSIDWGDGTQGAYPGDAGGASHVYAVGGHFTIHATASDEDGTWNANSLGVEIAAMSFQVTGFTQFDSGFHLDFNHAVDLGVLNLYNAASNPLGDADLVLTRLGAPSPIRGSLVLDHDLQGATFIKTKGLLDAGAYTLTLASRADGWKDSGGGLLDGNRDGLAGGNYVATFDVAASSSAILAIGEVLAGPGQSLTGYAPINQVPLDGLPITLGNAAGVTSLSFDLAYDPALLDITSVGFAAGVSGGYSLGTPGVVHISLTTPSLGTGAVDIARLYGGVPANAHTTSHYGAKQVLDLGNVSASRALRIDDGLLVNAYPGDASGNAAYDTLDISYMLRVIGGADSGFGAYPLVDSSVIGDINRDQSFSSADRLLFASELDWLTTGNAAKDRKEIVALPSGIGPITFTGADPLVDVPRDLDATAGGLVTVPVRLDIADQLEQVQLQLAWDASQLELVEVRRGSLTGGFDNYVENRQAGSLYVDMSSLTRLPGGAGTLLELVYRVAPTVSGVVEVNLQWAQLNQTHLTLNPAPQAGADPTDGAIRVTLAATPDSPVTPPVPATPERLAAQAGGAGPVIDFAGRYNGFEFKQSGEKDWLGDWLTDDKSRRPNLEALRIQPKVAPRLSARL